MGYAPGSDVAVAVVVKSKEMSSPPTTPLMDPVKAGFGWPYSRDELFALMVSVAFSIANEADALVPPYSGACSGVSIPANENATVWLPAWSPVNVNDTFPLGSVVASFVSVPIV